MKFLYSLAFLFGADHWKLINLPDEIKDSLKGLDKANANILDLGGEPGK